MHISKQHTFKQSGFIKALKQYFDGLYEGVGCPEKHTLQGYIQNRLTELEKPEVEKHINGCQACKVKLGFYKYQLNKK